MRLSRPFALPAIIVALCVLSVCVPAAAKISIVKGRGGPPVSISGFTYQFMPQGIHMNICNNSSCGLGSKVSYVFAAPKPGMTFGEYKAQRSIIEKELKARLPAQAGFKVRPPTQEKGKLLTTFESRRTLTMPDGEKQVTISRLLLTKTMSIELIGSGTDEKQIEMNLALFTIGTMTLAVSKDPARQAD
jgi:hypothetical protein